MKKINSKLMKGSVKEILPFIYGVSVLDKYDRAMLFCRYQEFYESPFKNIRGKYFTLEEFMKTYVTKNKLDCFTYTKDWSGYNIPCNEVQKANHMFSKETEYDVIMNDIYFYCAIDSQNKNNGTRHDWYLIGYGKDDSVLSHEIAHGLYFTNKKYKKEMNSLISKIKKTDYNFIKKKLIKMGYADDKKIIDDEVQAYMSTGLVSEFNTNKIKVYEKDFIDVYKNYRNERK